MVDPRRELELELELVGWASRVRLYGAQGREVEWEVEERRRGWPGVGIVVGAQARGRGGPRLTWVCLDLDLFGGVSSSVRSITSIS